MSFQRNLLPDSLSYFESADLKITGPKSGKWFTTECRFHGGSDSMRVNQATGGWVCMACGVKGGDLIAYEMQLTGDGFVDVAIRLGAWIEDGKSDICTAPKLPHRLALQVLEIESNLVFVAAGNLANGQQLTTVDRQRLLEAAHRIHVIAETCK